MSPRPHTVETQNPKDSNQRWKDKHMLDKAQLKAHEIAEITNWPIGKVFRRLKEKKIPAERTKRNGKLQFLVSPSAFSSYISKTGVEIGPKERLMLDEKLVEEEAYWKRRADEKMVRTSQSASKRFDSLRRLRATQQRLYEKLTARWLTAAPTHENSLRSGA